MTLWLGSMFLVGGALLCALAALGVLRLPDFFMRMHAATKAGVVGCGMLLVGVGFTEGTAVTWLKVAVAVVFLLMTTPVAGHLLGRAAYVAGAPFWRGTTADGLHDVLPRGSFDPARDATLEGHSGVNEAGARNAYDDLTAAADAPPVTVRRVVLALASGPCIDRAIAEAVALARRHGSELHGLAIIDTPRLANVGPVPIGGNWYAQQMRDRRIALARAAAAEAIEAFSTAAAASGLRWSVGLEEGRPSRIIASMAGPGCVIAAAQGGWFDQGVLENGDEASRRLARLGSRSQPVMLLGANVTSKRRSTWLQ